MATAEGYLGGYTPFLLAVLCIVAIGFSAATLTNASTAMVTNPATGPQPIVGESPTEQGSGTQNGGAIGSGAGGGTGADFTYCIEFLTNPLVVLGIVVAFFGLVALVAYAFSVAAGFLAGLSLVPPVTVTYFFLTNCQAGSVIGVGGGGVGSVARGVAASSPIPPWMAMGLVAGVVLVGGAVVLWGATGDETFGQEEAEEAPEETDVTEIAEAAGDAADRLERSADVENEVFRAWREMTDLLDLPNPDSSTPGEFATAAIEAGMNPDDVRALTGLFEEVRYGQAEADEERERSAVEILRHIEESYGAESADGDDRNDPEPER